jgi:hypothetical protein
MGFWARDRMDQLGLPEYNSTEYQVPPTFPCADCGLVFESAAEIAVHRFHGHFSKRPLIVANGRELGATRLIVTRATSPSDWVFSGADLVEVNGANMTPKKAAENLAKRTSGVVDITARGSGGRRLVQVEFALPAEQDLDGVDAALHDFIGGRELNRRTIIDFVDRGRRYATAGRYLDGLGTYLFGVLARESSPTVGAATSGGAEVYTARYDTAVTELKRYDRPPAEAISGIVAFHYNQFAVAMRRTRSRFVSATALRFSEILSRRAISHSGAIPSDSTLSLDLALSDSATERVLLACAASLDAPPGAPVSEVFDALDAESPYDQLKLRVIAAEQLLQTGAELSALEMAEPLRHERATEDWYVSIRERLESRDRRS